MTQQTYGTIGYRTRTQLGSLERLEGITSIIREQKITPARDYVLAAADIGKGTYDPQEFALRVGSTNAPLLVKLDMRAQIVLAAFGMMTNASRAQEVVVRDYQPNLKAWRAAHGIKLPAYLSFLESLVDQSAQDRLGAIEQFRLRTKPQTGIYDKNITNFYPFRQPGKYGLQKEELKSPLQRMRDEDAERAERKRKEHKRRYGIIPLEEFPSKIRLDEFPKYILKEIIPMHFDEQTTQTTEEELVEMLRKFLAIKKPQGE